MKKIGDSIEFKFAGGKEKGIIKGINKKGRKILSYSVSDGKYNYNVAKEMIL
jgi:hypothetical protein